MKRFIAFALTLMMLMSLLPSALADGPHTHVWKEVGRVDPTCTSGGYVTYFCSCGARKVENLPALGHDWATKVYTGYADCIHYGVFYWVCARCGAHSVTGNDAPLGHDWDEGKVTKQPTETEEGELTYTCKRDPSHTKTEPIPIVEHPALELSIDVNDMFEDHRYDAYMEGSFDETKVNVTHNVTNTGNVPLQTAGKYWYNGDTEFAPTSNNPSYLGPEETAVNEADYKIDSVFHPNGEDMQDYHTYVKETPDDPVNSGCVTISVCYYGYDPASVSSGEMELLCKSNVCTFTLYFPREGAVGEPTGLKAMKTETHAPANGEYYELGETIDYIITLTNESGSDVFNVAVYDSLAGFEPIAAAETFAQGETLQFEYSTVVTEDEIAKGMAVNSAVITFDYGNEVSATPRFSNHVHSKAGNTETPDAVRFDRTKLEAVPEYPSEDGTAEYLIAEAEKLYALLWEAGDDTAKCALLEERAIFYSYLEALESKTGDAASFRKLRAEALWERLASLAGITDTEAAAVPVGLSWEELIAETLRLKCLSLLALIRGLR